MLKIITAVIFSSCCPWTVKSVMAKIEKQKEAPGLVATDRGNVRNWNCMSEQVKSNHKSCIKS